MDNCANMVEPPNQCFQHPFCAVFMLYCSSGVRDPVIIFMFGEMNPECACVDTPSQDYFYFGWLALCNVFDLVYDF